MWSERSASRFLPGRRRRFRNRAAGAASIALLAVSRPLFEF
jgi:hypothetical protein